MDRNFYFFLTWVRTNLELYYPQASGVKTSQDSGHDPHWGKNAFFVHKCNFTKYDPGSQNRFISTKNTLMHLIMTIIVEFSDIFGWFGKVEVGVQSLLQFLEMSDHFQELPTMTIFK